MTRWQHNIQNANRYREQAAKDAEHVWRHVQLILKERGWSSESVMENDVKLFCKHSSELRMIRGSSLAAELDGKQLPGDVDISMWRKTLVFLLVVFPFLFVPCYPKLKKT